MEQVLREALSWLGTPYHHGARVKGAGVDCGQFPAAVFEACGLVPKVDIGDYPHDWHMHRGEERYLALVEKYFAKVADGVPLPGDLALFKFGRCISHGAIVIEWPQVIHAYLEAGAVVLDDAAANMGLAKRFVGIWRLKKCLGRDLPMPARPPAESLQDGKIAPEACAGFPLRIRHRKRSKPLQKTSAVSRGLSLDTVCRNETQPNHKSHASAQFQAHPRRVKLQNALFVLRLGSRAVFSADEPKIIYDLEAQ
jgi:hypothetical protein